MPKARVERSVEIPDGSYEGIIRETQWREIEGEKGTFEYVDVFIDIEEFPEVSNLKVSYPFKITQLTLLGQVLQRFGVNLEDVGAMIEIDDYLLGRKVYFSLMNKETSNGKFAVIDKNSIVPLKRDAQTKL